MRTRSLAISLMALTLLLGAAGCATHQGPDAAASIPTGPSAFRGAWYGSSHEIGASSTHYSSSYALDIKDDGTWTLTETMRGGGVTKYSGTSTVSGDRLVLSESAGRRWISLKPSGNRLYGFENVKRSGSDSAHVMIEFTRMP